TLIGAASLHRAYRTTVRLYQGEYTAAAPKVVAPPSTPAPVPAPAANRSLFLERTLPLVPERTAAIALATLVGLWRAPEVKLQLLSPLIVGVVFGWLFLTNTGEPPPQTRVFMAIGGMTIVLLSMVQLVGNAFGYDRAGFRVFVLGPAPRRDVLLGK